jgi:hypothetical protein
MTNIVTRSSPGDSSQGGSARADSARAGQPGRRERPVRPGLVLAVVLIGQFMAVLDASIVNVAAPSPLSSQP